MNSALLLCHGCGVHQLFFCQLSLLAVVTVIEREHVHADVRPSEAADAIVAELVAEAEAQRAAEKSTAQLRLRPRPQPRAQRRTAAPNDKVAAATAAAAAATAALSLGQVTELRLQQLQGQLLGNSILKLKVSSMSK